MSREARLPEAVQVARLSLMKDYPYLSAGLMALIPVESEQCPTMAVDMFWRLYFNPGVVATWNHEEIKAVLWHELTHLTHEHHDRARIMGAYHQAWNVAADAEINDDLRDIGMTLPEGCVYPESIVHKKTKKPMDEHLMAEEYYEGLDIQVVSCSCPDPNGEKQDQPQSSDGSNGSGDGQKSPESQQGSGKESDGGSSGDHQGDGDGCSHQHQNTSGNGQGGQGSGQSTDSGQQGQSQSGSGQGTSGGGTTDPDCPIHGKNPIPSGSGSGMQPAPWEPQTQDGDDGEGTRKVAKAEAEIIRRTVAEETKETAQKNRGTVPAFMERWAKEKLMPQVPWRQVLRGAVRKMLAETSGATDYTRRKPNRRQAAYGKVIMPSLRTPVPNVVMAIDTSGSMSDKELAAGLAEVKGVLKSLGMRDMLAFPVDASPGPVQNITNPDKIRLSGGGGTDMGVAIQVAEMMKNRPDFLIIHTDGYTPWPSTPPSFKVIVVSTTPGVDGPEWAKTVHIDMERGR